MVPQKFVVRMLAEDDSLIAWAEVLAEPKPQPRPAASCPFWPVPGGTSPFYVEKIGRIVRMSVHWCDLDVARVDTIAEPLDVTTLDARLVFAWLQPVWLVPGMRDVPLPAVTVRQSITLSPLPGSLGATGLSLNTP